MIKFFRHIRKSLLNEGKTSKYFKYAIGEIVLVVIGILIALQINTWNENRKSQDVKNNYYTQILQDLAKDYKYINNHILTLKSNIALYNEFVNEFPNQKNPEAIVMSASKLNYIFPYLRFNTNTIETLQTTGDVKLFPMKIRNNLIDLKNLQNNIIVITNGNNANFMKEFLNAIKLGYSPNTISLKGENIQSNQLYNELKVADNFQQMALNLNAAFGVKNFTERDQLNGFTSMIEDINSLFTLINKELGNPYETIETVIKSQKKLEKLLESGKTIDEVIAIVKNQDRDDPEYDISENYINALGYYVMNTMKQNSEALKLFKLNIELYPNASNAYDSYGECLLIMGDKESAIKAYQKSLELNPENDSAKKVLSELK